jgi:hypothetical protein|tara:strand:- start:162 stop:656 length:495 start_codon:yes stop_codon:yes gene_type:complete
MYKNESRMKKSNLNLLLVILFLGFSVMIISCKEDEKPKAEDQNEIVGTWKLSAATPQKTGVTITALTLLPTVAPCYLDLKFVFKSDNNVTVSGCDAATSILSTTGYLTVGSATNWKVENKQLKLTNDASVQTFDLIQNGDTMSMVVVTDATNTDLNVLLTFQRQ